MTWKKVRGKRKLLVVLVLMAMVIPYLLLTAQASDTGTVVGEWHFNEGEGTTVTDSSGNSNNGTIQGATWVNGKMGKALNFDGDDYVEIPYNAILNPRNALTVEAWINPASNILWHKALSKPGDYGLFCGGNNNVAFTVKMGSVSQTAYAPANSTPIGSWSYVVGTYDGTRLSIYINGQRVNSFALCGEINAHTEPLKIGIGSSTESFQGMIDEVKIYNIALTAEEILSRYQTAMQVVAPNVLEVTTTTDGTKILATFDKDMAQLPVAPAGFNVTVDGVDNPIQAVALNSNNAIVELTLTNPIYANETNIQLSYTAGTVASADGGVLADFSNLSVINNSTAPFAGVWHFDEGEGTIAGDSSGNSNSGTIQGATWVNGKMGTALNFDGDDYVEIAYNPILNPRKAITVEAWINPASNILWHKALSKPGDYGLFCGGNNNVAFTIKMGSIAQTAYAPANSTPIGTWSYVVGTYDGTRLSIYINGKRVNSFALCGEINAHEEPLKIGIGSSTESFQGLIDEVKIYNVGLTAEEILNRYQAATQVIDAVVTPTTATFDKYNPGNLTVTMELNENTLSGLKNGTTDLVRGTDYTVTDNIVTINQTYLLTQPLGTCNLTFDFSAGNDPIVAVTVVDSTPEAPIVVEAATATDGTKVLVTFDKNMAALPAAPAGFSVNVDGADNPIQAVELNVDSTIIELTLTEIIYTNTNTIQVSYTAGTVSSVEGGRLASFSNQNVLNHSTIVQVNDSTITPLGATFDKNEPTDLTVTMELNGNTFLGLKNGQTELVNGTDYSVANNIVTINQAYLLTQPLGTCNLTFDFSAGNDPVFAITVIGNPVAAPVLVSAETDTDGTKILVTFDKKIAELPAAPAGFNVTMNGVNNRITAAKLNKANSAIVELSIERTIPNNVVDLQAAYTAGTVTANDGGVLASFTNQNITNKSNIVPPTALHNCTYNDLNQISYILMPNGKTAHYRYDIKGNLISVRVLD